MERYEELVNARGLRLVVSTSSRSAVDVWQQMAQLARRMPNLVVASTNPDVFHVATFVCANPDAAERLFHTSTAQQDRWLQWRRRWDTTAATSYVTFFCKDKMRFTRQDDGVDGFGRFLDTVDKSTWQCIACWEDVGDDDYIACLDCCAPLCKACYVQVRDERCPNCRRDFAVATGA